jgi:hypothetical protein
MNRCCGDVSARRTQLSGYVSQVSRLITKMNEVKRDPTGDKSDASGPERDRVMGLTSTGGVADLVKEKLAGGKAGRLFSSILLYCPTLLC